MAMQFRLCKIAQTITLFSAVAFVTACATSPTGRNQIILYPDAQLDAMGEQAFAGMKEGIKISTQRVANNLVQCIAREITAQVDKSVFAGAWEVIVFDDLQVNAFALPGGKIGVYTGLLGVAQNQDQIASVIGHEVGHVISRHGNERMSNAAVVGMSQQVVGQVLAANQVAQSQIIMQALGVGAQLGTFKYSRDHESEADEIGLELMAKAGFKPQGAIDLWRNMASQGGERPPEFMSTHPSESKRIENLTRKLPSANAIYKQSKPASCE